jgi:hypothetical protein
VRWKLASVRRAFDGLAAPALEEARLVPILTHVSAENSDVELIVDRIASDVATSPDRIVSSPGYAHLSLAVIDAVYSIRSRYSAVQNVVAAYCSETGTTCDPLTARSDAGFHEHGLDQLLHAAGSLSGTHLADLLFAGSRSRSAGILKADLCVEVAHRLQAVSVTQVDHLRQRADDAEVRHAWTGVRGLGWVTWQYFCSLVGIDQMRPDIMLMRFAADTLLRNVGPAEADALLCAAFDQLRASWPTLTKRALDHTVRRFQRDQRI